MPKYKVRIADTIWYEFVVEAPNEQMADKIALETHPDKWGESQDGNTSVESVEEVEDGDPQA